jgi:hypothetical protein
MKDMTPENLAKRKIKAYLDTLAPNLLYFSVSAGPHSRAGVADIICCYQGRFFSIEVKSVEAYKKKDHGRSAAQSKFGMHVFYAGGYALTSCEPEGVRAFIETIMPPRDEGLFLRRKEGAIEWEYPLNLEQELAKE